MGATSLAHALEVCADAAVSSSGPGLRVGVDVMLVSEVAASVDTFGDSYLDRIYTPGELVDCGRDASRLAARFAVKEAVTKVLAPRDAPGWWRDIETVRAASGACELHLRGAAAEAAGPRLWSVSLTHEGDYAAAVVIAAVTGSETFPQEAEA